MQEGSFEHGSARLKSRDFPAFAVGAAHKRVGSRNVWEFLRGGIPFEGLFRKTRRHTAEQHRFRHWARVVEVGVAILSFPQHRVDELQPMTFRRFLLVLWLGFYDAR